MTVNRRIQCRPLSALQVYLNASGRIYPRHKQVQGIRYLLRMLYVFFKALKSILKLCYMKHKVIRRQQTKVSERLLKGVINSLFDTDGFVIFYAYKAALDGAFPLQLIFPVTLGDHFQTLIILFRMIGIARHLKYA